MTTPTQIYAYGGTYTPLNDAVNVTATGLPLQIPLSSVYTRVDIFNSTQWGLSPLVPVMKKAWWTNANPQGSAFLTQNVASTTQDQSVAVSANGIYLINSAYPPLYPVTTGGTTITATNPAVATINNNFVDGQVILLNNVQGAAQLNGYMFTISNVTSTGFTIPYLDASGFAAGATSFNARPVYPPTFLATPALGQITNIQSVGINTVITLASQTNMFVGGTAYVTLPTEWGMQELNTAGIGIPNPFQIIAIDTTTNQITINVNSSFFSPFTFPTNATASSLSLTIPQLNPYGQGSFFNNSSQVFQYQNTTILNGGWILGLGFNVCGNAGDILNISLTAQGTISQYPSPSPT